MTEKEYAIHMIRWINKLGLPDIEPAKRAFFMAKSFWKEGNTENFEAIKNELWLWVDNNGGPRITSERDMVIVRMIMCVASEDVTEVRDMGFFEDLLVSLGFSYDEAYEGTE
ncbi:hypothetical protein C7H09_09230 [Marinobacter fuscus]|uniref:Uncharacterized protein n=1 Tax=Marinobacter fuscus TaxID=2109942 RepID=A0A2T1KDD8_9GAMM|nr:hypothetical protein [Marinobacter fuscus]PSF08125.1 hypothetical protein C7H09_09230 [Marinobacter fuscus]